MSASGEHREWNLLTRGGMQCEGIDYICLDRLEVQNLPRADERDTLSKRSHQYHLTYQRQTEESYVQYPGQSNAPSPGPSSR